MLDHPCSFEPSLQDWAAWSPAEVARRLEGVDSPWYVAAGWAIDLFLGGGLRGHEDIEIGVPARDFPMFAHALSECDLFVVGSKRAIALEHAGGMLAEHHQTWVRERGGGPWRLDIFREPSGAGRWVARRDARITLAYEELILRTKDGIPYACPEAALLFKAKAARPKDQMDFDAVLPHLGAGRRAWLRHALRMAHPAHPWITALGD